MWQNDGWNGAHAAITNFFSAFLLPFLNYYLRENVFWRVLIISFQPSFWDRLIKNNLTGGNIWDKFSYCFRYVFYYSRGMIWLFFFCRCIQVYYLFSYMFGYVLVSTFVSSTRILTIWGLVCIFVFKLHSFNSLAMAFLFLLISGPDKSLTIANQFCVINQYIETFDFTNFCALVTSHWYIKIFVPLFLYPWHFFAKQ